MMAQVEMNDQVMIEAIADSVAVKVMPELENLVKKYYQPDQGLNQQGAADLLGCSTDTLKSYYLLQPGFPHYMKGTQIAFSRKAIEKWMDENQIYS